MDEGFCMAVSYAVGVVVCPPPVVPPPVVPPSGTSGSGSGVGSGSGSGVGVVGS